MRWRNKPSGCRLEPAGGLSGSVCSMEDGSDNCIVDDGMDSASFSLPPADAYAVESDRADRRELENM